MLFVDLLFAMLFSVVIFPLTTGYCAYNHGRSFWLWFALGCFLPVASFFVLCALVYREQADPGQRLVDEAKAILAAAAEKELMKNEE